METPAGVPFSSTEHILPRHIEELMRRRIEAKDKGQTHLAQAIKILMNSFYGVMGSANCRFYHADLPKAITLSGQWILKEAIKFIESRGYQVVYGDTDSVFVTLKEEDRFNLFDTGKSLAQMVTDHVTKLLQDQFQVESKLEMEFEKMFKKIFFPEARHSAVGAKKEICRAGSLSQGRGRNALFGNGIRAQRLDRSRQEISMAAL